MEGFDEAGPNITKSRAKVGETDPRRDLRREEVRVRQSCETARWEEVRHSGDGGDLSEVGGWGEECLECSARKFGREEFVPIKRPAGEFCGL